MQIVYYLVHILGMGDHEGQKAHAGLSYHAVYNLGKVVVLGMVIYLALKQVVQQVLQYLRGFEVVFPIWDNLVIVKEELLDFVVGRDLLSNFIVLLAFKEQVYEFLILVAEYFDGNKTESI